MRKRNHHASNKRQPTVFKQPKARNGLGVFVEWTADRWQASKFIAKINALQPNSELTHKPANWEQTQSFYWLLLRSISITPRRLDQFCWRTKLSNHTLTHVNNAHVNANKGFLDKNFEPSVLMVPTSSSLCLQGWLTSAKSRLVECSCSVFHKQAMKIEPESFAPLMSISEPAT